MRTIVSFFIVILSIIITGCTNNGDRKMLTDEKLLHQNMQQLTGVIILDMFSPPVSSRIYCYTSLAAYEALRFAKPGYTSIAEQLSGFPKMPQPEKDKEYNFLLAATKAFFTVAEKITFSKDSLIQYQDKLYPKFESFLDKEVYDRSLSFGDSVGKQILLRAARDNYKETRGMAKFIGSDSTGRWRPTSPDYLDALEPNWALIKTLAVSSEQCECPAPPPFSTDTTSEFFKYTKEVYDITTHLTDSQRAIAKYWDDNPFVIEHSGHLMYGNKKITPVGHWIGITGIAAIKTKSDAVKTAQAYALTSVAMFDVINACWKMKFKYNHIRPVTVINEYIDRNWQPFLQTPPFPEHSSGHSGISASAATVLTSLFGDNFAFEDTSDLAYIGMKRSFSSFLQAADEASISRVYGGIHYRSGVDAGAVQGREVGKFVIDKFLKKQPVQN